jgi:pantetheine-phosphate adenylyltransferase
MRTALFPGTFDPITEGHLDIIRRALKIFDGVTVAVAKAVHKDTLFAMEERRGLVEASVTGIDGVTVVEFEGLLVDLAEKLEVSAVVRGLRFVSDFEYEFQLALMNRQLNPRFETVFMMPSARYSFLNATIVREVARLGGDVTGLVPPVVVDRLRERFRQNG